MEASSSGATARSRAKTLRRSGTRSGSIHSLGPDQLCSIFAFLDHFNLVRCSAVCNSWRHIIYTSSLLEDLYYKIKPCSKDDQNLPQASIMVYLKNLAFEQHRLSFLNDFVDVHQWNAHSARINLCRMKRGSILTGGEDKVLRLWSTETYKQSNEYSFSGLNPFIDCDFDEHKIHVLAIIFDLETNFFLDREQPTWEVSYHVNSAIVGMTGSQICIWRRSERRSIFQSREGTFTRGLCMGYIDPEAVIGCEDGRAPVFDMYSGSCSRIIRIHSGPLTCMALTEDQFILGGSTFGRVTIADISSGEQMGILKSSVLPTAIKTLCFNEGSSLVFAGSTSGYAHCWDLRTLRPLWETRVSPNVIYSMHYLTEDASVLAVGGLDGVLRILNQSTGEVISRFISDAGLICLASNTHGVKKQKGRALKEYANLDVFPKTCRPSITCLAVGMKKIVTTHNEKYVRMWRF